MAQLVVTVSDLAHWLPSPGVWLVAIWMAALGGAIGSFINVLVYRLPAGKSIIHPGSACPHCGHPIRPRDNIPVISWFVLRGRCRDCGEPISVRYPLVEIMMSLVFVSIGVVEVLLGGANLPHELGQRSLTVAGPLLWAIYAYHLVLICALVCMALIDHDGNRVPLRLPLLVVAAGLLAPLLPVALHPVDLAGALGVGKASTSTFSQLATAPVGCLAGGLLGAVAWPLRPGQNKLGDVLAVAMVGTFLGWQAAVALAAITAILMAFGLAICGGTSRVPGSAWLAAFTVGYILSWCLITLRFPGVVTDAGLIFFGLACLAVLGASWGTRLVRRGTSASLRGVK
jgi:leader peptidase (prepilin peptidase)/N-methyltransferase